jgi:ATP-dependent DNA ligase
MAMNEPVDPLPLDLPPMEAEPVDDLPLGGGWQYEPKYDGFRCLAHRAGLDVRLQSKNRKPLERYFPEVAAGLASLAKTSFVLDGELVIRGGSFEALQLRLHPAESRIRKLSEETPAQLVAFDLLAFGGTSFLERPLAERRLALAAFMAEAKSTPVLRLGEATESEPLARRWLGREGLDGIVAKRLDQPYLPGERAMRKFKLWKTVDCVVGGLYRKSGTQVVEHLLLGLYDEERRLNYVGRTRIHEDAAEIGRLLEPLVGGPGFTGRAPGGKSRWSGKQRVPVPLKPVLVVEVSADHITDEHMRHGSRFLRWRTDKPPETCTMDQINR